MLPIVLSLLPARKRGFRPIRFPRGERRGSVEMDAVRRVMLTRLLVPFLFVSFCFFSLTGLAAPVPLPASDAFVQWIGQHKAGNSQDLAAGLQLAQSSATEMKALLQSDPAQFISRAMPDTVRSALPSEIQAVVEHRVNARGSFLAYCAGF